MVVGGWWLLVVVVVVVVVVAAVVVVVVVVVVVAHSKPFSNVVSISLAPSELSTPYRRQRRRFRLTAVATLIHMSQTGRGGTSLGSTFPSPFFSLPPTSPHDRRRTPRTYTAFDCAICIALA
jgi:hypothetical protein